MDVGDSVGPETRVVAVELPSVRGKNELRPCSLDVDNGRNHMQQRFLFGQLQR